MTKPFPPGTIRLRFSMEKVAPKPAGLDQLAVAGVRVIASQA